AAHMGMSAADLIVPPGVRSDARPTGRLAASPPHASIIHVNIDPGEISKNRAPEVPIVGDVKRVLEKLNKTLGDTKPSRGERNAAARRAWWGQIHAWKDQFPLVPSMSDTEIKPQHLMAEIDRI